MRYKIDIDYNNRKKVFNLSFPFDLELIEYIKKTLPLRQYNKSSKVWEVPELAITTLDLLNNIEFNWDSSSLSRKKVIENSVEKLVELKLAEGEEKQPEEWNVSIKLRSYQIQGVKYLMMAKRALLADDLGLGKTIQSISTVLNLKTEKNLIICPSTLKYNWRNELIKHFDIEPVVVHGNKKKRLEQWNENNLFHIVSYDSLRVDINDINKNWDSIIADEIVYLKTHNSQRTKAANKLKSDIKIGLSGIPIENHLSDFYSIFHWIRPELSMSAYQFQERYMPTDEWYNTQYQNIDELHSYSNIFILRREKEKVLKELPPKQYSEYPLELSDIALKSYKALKQQLLSELIEQTGSVWTPESVMTNTIRLRQFIENPKILDFYNIPNVKLEWLKDTYNNSYNPKFVVFCCFIPTVEMLVEEFKTPYYIMGSVDKKERVNIIDDFNNAKTGMLVMTDAGKFGLNITQCSYLVHYGYFYNPATIEQREGRLHRIGQENTVNILKPFIEYTIDKSIMRIADGREKFSNDFMSKLYNTSLQISNKNWEDFIDGKFEYIM